MDGLSAEGIVIGAGESINKALRVSAHKQGSASEEIRVNLRNSRTPLVLSADAR